MTLCARRWTTLRFQFTPLREGRRVRHALTDDVGDISIHAPPRGATSFPEQARLLFHFNSRPSARGDASHDANQRNAVISIHAPPRGATSFRSSCGSIVQFQFTPLREGRRQRHHRVAHAGQFQFTPLREGRPSGGVRLPPSPYFNSRPSARGDVAHRRAEMPGDISIHAPPRGATREELELVCKIMISIHAPPRGATSGERSARTTSDHFNSRPSARGDNPGRVSKV